MNKKNKLPNLLKSHWAKILSIFFFVLLLGAYANIFAIGSPYSPGEILDPECTPGSENCIVNIEMSSSLWAASGSNIYYNEGNAYVGGNTASVTSFIPGKSSFNLLTLTDLNIG